VPAPICLIVNPSAGGGRAARIAPEVEDALRAQGLSVRTVHTRDLDHARELALEAAGAGETVAALSGDGLVGVLADTLRDSPGAVLGVLPGGRGNDLARVLEIPADPAGACRVFAGGVARPLDLGLVEPLRGGPARAFVGIASVGFDSDANRIANEAPAWLGGLVYAYGALRALLSWRPARFELELDGGEPRSFTGYSVAAANSRAYGGGMYAAPDAMLDDGLLDVVVVEHVSRLRFLQNLPKVFKGAHVGEPSVHVFRCAEVKISADRPFEMYADGDPVGALPARVTALRGAVAVVTPAAGAAALSQQVPPAGDGAPAGAAPAGDGSAA
jgi:YegS/Rv2252/BmrU family lipid kinase